MMLMVKPTITLCNQQSYVFQTSPHFGLGQAVHSDLGASLVYVGCLEACLGRLDLEH